MLLIYILKRRRGNCQKTIEKCEKKVHERQYFSRAQINDEKSEKIIGREPRELDMAPPHGKNSSNEGIKHKMLMRLSPT